MAIFKKSTLQSGRTYQSPDGQVVVTNERLRHWADTFQAMKVAGAVIPIAWDHAADPAKMIPLSLKDYEQSRSARDTVGRLLDVRHNGDSAELTLEITDPTAEGRVERNEVFISPVVFTRWKHGDGQEFADCFTHIDLVNHPVDYLQSGFTKVEPGFVACALRMGAYTSPADQKTYDAALVAWALKRGPKP